MCIIFSYFCFICYYYYNFGPFTLVAFLSHPKEKEKKKKETPRRAVNYTRFGIYEMRDRKNFGIVKRAAGDKSGNSEEKVYTANVAILDED